MLGRTEVGKNTMRKSAVAVAMMLSIALLSSPAQAQLGDLEKWAKGKIGEVGVEALKGVAIGYAVKQSAKPLNQFINTVTLRQGVKDTQTTKVVPVLSLGDKAYIGGAQVSGPYMDVLKTQAVWQIEGTKQIGDGLYRIKGLVPSSSLNPLKLSRVPRVGISALIDVATGGTIREGPYSKPVRGGDLIKAGAVAVAVNAAAKPLNEFINIVTVNNNRATTKVTPLATFGERAYVGGGQLSGSSSALAKSKMLWQYEDLFDRGRFRVKILVPTDGINPLKIRRVPGVGLSAVLDTTIQRQAASLESKRPNNTPRVVPVSTTRPAARPAVPRPAPRPVVVPARKPSARLADYREPSGPPRRVGRGRHDNGKHKGWYKDKGKRDRDRDHDNRKRGGHGHGRGHDD